MKTIKALFIPIVVLGLLSNGGCNKEDQKQNLCSEKIDFTKENWVKDKLDFFNWEYLDYPVNDNLITDVFELTNSGDTYFVMEFHDESLYFYDCKGDEIDQSEASNISLIHELTNGPKAKIWPINTGYYTGGGVGGGGGGAW